jgi:hypothetical protein
MTRYQPLQQHLAQQTSRELPMTFEEIEGVIGSPLPASARSHRPWWSNNHGTNPAAQAWRAAGRKTARVDMAAERVVFVKEEGPPAVGSITFEGSSAGTSGSVRIPIDRLTKAARRLYLEELERAGGDATEALLAMLHRAGVSYSLSNIRRMNRGLPLDGVDSVDLIREERDAR